MLKLQNRYLKIVFAFLIVLLVVYNHFGSLNISSDDYLVGPVLPKLPKQSKTDLIKQEDERRRKCESHFRKLYKENPDWHHKWLVNKFDYDDKSLQLVQDMIISMDLYEDCKHLEEKEFPDLRDKIFPFMTTNHDISLPKYQGRGIVTTFAPKDIPIAKRMIKSIRTMSNMPIEVVHAGELPESIYLGENVKVTNIGGYINKKFIVQGFLMKWYALLYSSFKEVLLIDADCVLFVSPERMFDLYDGTTLLFRDRDLIRMKQKKECVKAFNFFSLPDIPKYSGEWNDKDIRHKFFDNKEKELIETGVLLTNKDNQLKSLLAGFMMHLTGQLRFCQWGDKEFFWLGHVYMNQRISIHPEPASMVGTLNIEGEVCSMQIAHAHNNRLLWTNGGLAHCKMDAAWRDRADVEYYKKMGVKEGNMQKIYSGPIEMTSLFNPIPEKDPWRTNGLCKNRMFCMSLEKSTRVDFSSERLAEIKKSYGCLVE